MDIELRKKKNWMSRKSCSVIVDEPRNVEEHLLRNVGLIEQPECVNSTFVEEHLDVFAHSAKAISVSHLQSPWLKNDLANR